MIDVKVVTVKKDHPLVIDLFPISKFHIEVPDGFKKFIAPENNMV